MNFNFNIKIVNSFNKKNVFQRKEKPSFGNDSTLGGDRNIIETTSASVSSLTNDQDLNDVVISRVRDRKSNLFLRDIFVGVIGSTLGAIITYFILNFL